MSTFDYTRTRATADRLLARFGQTGAIRRVYSTGPVYDPVQTTTDYACTLVVTEYDKRDIDGTLILQTDRKVLVAVTGLSVVPTVTDRAVVEGVPLTIVAVMPLSPGGTVVMYELQVRV